MTNLHNENHRENHQNLVSFLRHNRPTPPHAEPDLEQRIMDSLEPRTIRDRQRHFKVTWTIPSAIATGFLFTSVSFGIRTPRIAIEPKDLENFLVNNWQDTLDNHYDGVDLEEAEAYWLLPNVYEQQPALSVSAQ